MFRISMTAILFFMSLHCASPGSAQDITFETADGKFQIVGRVSAFLVKGKAVESPAGDEEGLAVVIIKRDGKLTKPVPLILLSTKTKQSLFSKATPATQQTMLGKTKKNSIGMELILLPAGEFTTGAAAGDSAEEPHVMTVAKPFYLGVYEVTQKQYERVMRANPSEFKFAQNPVERVSWEEAVTFCRKLSELPEERSAGLAYRLPTEAEWEYACRAGTTTAYSFGDDASELIKYGWYASNAKLKTHPVGQKYPNAWGLYDMHGNVWEFCQEWYKIPGKGRVCRGGSLSSGAMLCRSAFRNGITPSAHNSRYGFRVVCVPSDDE